MKKLLLTLFVSAGMVSATWAQTTIIDTDFATGYVSGSIVGQTNWANMPNTSPNAFYIAGPGGVAGTGYADGTLSTGEFNTTNLIGQYVYLNTTSASNNVDDEWAGQMDFVIDAGTATNLPATKIFNIGLSGVSTNKLHESDLDDVFINFRITKTGNLDVRFNGSSSTKVVNGWEGVNLGWDGVSDFKTQDLRINWTIRKTSDEGIYGAMASITNLVSGSNITAGAWTYSSRPGAYSNAAPDFAMGRHENADFNGSSNIVSVVIDNLKFEKYQNVAAAPTAPIVSILAGDGQVDLSWSFLYDVDSYKVERSLNSGGPWTTVTNGLPNTETSFTDTSVVNNQLYYYQVTAFYGAVEAVSSEVSATPVSIVTGDIFDTSFKSSEGYVDGNLNGQTKWLSLSGSGANAFDVDSSGDGFSDTSPVGASWNTTNGNAVYWTSTMSNGVNATWSGTVDFQLSTVAFPGEYKTNTWYEYDIAGSITNSITTNEVVNAVATSQNQNFLAFELALTASDADALDVNISNQVHLSIQSRSGFGLRTTFNSTGNNRALNTAMEPELLGWDPAWSSQTNLLTDGPDFESDPIRLTYTIQKSAGQDFYVGMASLSNMVTGVVSTNDGTNAKIADWWEYEKPAAYDSPLLRFAMGKSRYADGTQNVGDAAESSELDIKIDAMSLTHSNDAAPLLFPPLWSVASPVTASSGQNELVWQSGMSAAEGYVVLRSVHDGGPYSQIAVLTNEISYLDTDVNDVWTYYYVLRSFQDVFESANGDQKSGTPIPVSNILKLGGAGTTYCVGTSQNKPSFDNMSATTVSNIAVRSGIFIENGNPATLQSMGTADNTVRGYLQCMDVDWRRARVFNRVDPQYPKVEFTGTGSGIQTNSAILMYVQADEMDAAAATVDLSAKAYEYALSMNNFSPMGNSTTSKFARAAVRQGGNWYVSEDSTDSATVLTIADLGAANWGLLDISPVDSFWTSIGISYGSQTLDQVDAIGWFVENAKVLQVLTLSVSAEDASSISEYQWWEAANLILPPSMGTDTDLDGKINLWEYGLNGDPNDDQDTGVEPVTDVVNIGGTNYFQYVHLRRKGDNLGIDYSIKDTWSLLYEPITNDTTIAEQYVGDYDADYETVTNLIPVVDDEKFLRLELKGL